MNIVLMSKFRYVCIWILQFYLDMVWGLPCNSIRFTYSNSSSIQGQPVLVIPFFQGGLTMCQPGPANILHYFNRFACLGSFLIMFFAKNVPFYRQNCSSNWSEYWWFGGNVILNTFHCFLWKKEFLWMGDLKWRFKNASKI